MSRERDTLLPPIVLDRASSTPLYRQLGEQLSAALGRGTLDGARLPSTRLLARLLGLSRNTVLAAYADLVARGLVTGQSGSGTRVSIARQSARLAPQQVLRQAQFPARTLGICAPDGTPVYLSFPA